MSGKFETLEELETWCIEKGAAGVTELLTKELRQTKEENKKLTEENLSVKLALAEQVESTLSDKLELQLAIAEMVEGGNL